MEPVIYVEEHLAQDRDDFNFAEVFSDLDDLIARESVREKLQLFITETGQVLWTSPIQNSKGYRAKVLSLDGHWNLLDTLPEIKMGKLGDKITDLNYLITKNGKKIYFQNIQALPDALEFTQLMRTDKPDQRKAFLKKHASELKCAVADLQEQAAQFHFEEAEKRFLEGGTNTDMRSIMLSMLNAWRDLQTVILKKLEHKFEQEWQVVSYGRGTSAHQAFQNKEFLERPEFAVDHEEEPTVAEEVAHPSPSAPPASESEEEEIKHFVPVIPEPYSEKDVVKTWIPMDAKPDPAASPLAPESNLVQAPAPEVNPPSVLTRAKETAAQLVDIVVQSQVGKINLIDQGLEEVARLMGEVRLQEVESHYVLDHSDPDYQFLDTLLKQSIQLIELLRELAIEFKDQILNYYANKPIWTLYDKFGELERALEQAHQYFLSNQYDGRERCQSALETANKLYFEVMKMIDGLPFDWIHDARPMDAFLQKAVGNFYFPTKANLVWEKDDHNCDVRALTAAIEELSSFCPEARAFNIAEIFFDQAAPGFEPQSLSPIEGDLKRARAARLTWRALQPESPLIPWAMQKSPGFAAVLSRVILPMNQLMLEHHSHQDPTPEQAPLYQVLELVERNSSILTSMPFWNGERKAHDIHLAVKKIRDRIKGLEKCTRELGLSDEERALANQELRKILNVEWPRLVFESGLWDALANRRAFLTTQFHYKYTRSAAELLSLVPVLEEYRSLWHRLEPVKPAEVSMPVCVSEIQDIAIAASALLRLMRSPLRSPLRDSPLADCIEKAMKNYAEEAERLKVKWADDPRSLREVGWDQVVLRTGLWDAMSKHSEEKSRFRLDVDEVLERLSKYSQDWELPLPEKKGVVEAVGKLRRMGLQPCFDQIFRFSKKSCSILSGSVNPLGPFSVMYRHLRKDPARFAAYEQLLADIKKLDESVAKFQIALKRTGFQRVFGTINPDARVFGTINLADMGAYDILEFAWFKLILESPLWAHFSKGGVLAEFLPDRRARLVKNLRPLLDELNVFADEWSLKRLAQYRKEALYSEPDITSGLKSERDESSEQEVLSPVN